MGWRRLWVALFAAWIVGGALFEHGTRTRLRVLPGWFMYTAHAARICEVAWFERTDAGDQPIDRAATLGRPPWHQQTAAERNLMGREEVLAEAAQLCAALPGVDLRADVQCGSMDAWRPAMARETPLCR